MGEQSSFSNQKTLAVQQAIDNALQHHLIGDLGKAEALYKKILESNPNQSDALHYLGVISFQIENYDIAIDLIRKSIKVNPDNHKAHSNLGLVFQRQGKFNDAVNCFNKALEIKSDSAEAYNNLGNALKALGQLDDASTNYSTALTIKPDYAEAHNNLGFLFQEQGKLEDAVDCYHKALANNPNFAGAHNNLGNAYLEKLELENAIACYRKALAIDPNFADVHNNLGNAYLEQINFEDALASYHKALAINPNFADAYNNLGNAHKEQGNLDDSLASYQKALAINPYYADAHASLAIYFWIRAQWDECTYHIKALSEIELIAKTKRNQFVYAYYDFIEKLIDYRAGHPNQYEPEEKLPALYSFGESHCLAPAHTIVRIHKKSYYVEPKIIIGCKAWHLANQQNNKYKIQFEKISNSFKSGTKVVVMFGEIDCRPDEGILLHHIKTGNDLPIAICELVKSYVNYVVNMLNPKGVIPIFYGVPARHSEASQNVDVEIKLASIIQQFNKALQKEVTEKKMLFLDVYTLTKNSEGRSNGELHIDGTHMSPSVLGNLTSLL